MPDFIGTFVEVDRLVCTERNVETLRHDNRKANLTSIITCQVVMFTYLQCIDILCKAHLKSNANF